jgi:hypothetical protein
MATKISGKRQRRRHRKTKSGQRNGINHCTGERPVNSTEGQRSFIIIIIISLSLFFSIGSTKELKVYLGKLRLLVQVGRLRLTKV